MKSSETATVWFGTVKRTIGKSDSSILKQLPKSMFPNPEPACATCPAKDWYLTLKQLRCYCTHHRFVSWVSNTDPVMVCDAREQMINEGE